MTTNKPAKNHPWKNECSNEALKWAREKSSITNTHNFSLGTLEGTKKTKTPKRSQF